MPSGHAGMSMCVFSMVAALLLSDAYYFLKMPQQEGRQYYKLLGYAAFGIMLV